VTVRAVLVEERAAGGDGVGGSRRAGLRCRRRGGREVERDREWESVALGRAPDLRLELAQRPVDPLPERVLSLADADADTPLHAVARDRDHVIGAAEPRAVEITGDRPPDERRVDLLASERLDGFLRGPERRDVEAGP
jgi:hypothetical protein